MSTESLWRVCIGSDRVNCSSGIIWPQLWRVARHTRLRHMGAEGNHRVGLGVGKGC